MAKDADSFGVQKRKIVSRKRRVIFNNDGGDAVKITGIEHPEDFLHVRTTPLRGSHVDTVTYHSGIFGACRHDTKVGHLSQTCKSSVIPELIKQGTDPLAKMVEYCRENGMEIFCSMRMNDIHDSSRPESFKENPFKTENRDCLLGTEDAPPLYGGWSAVNYGCGKVRDMILCFIGEVCRHYDVDGIELDFFRHPVFFKQTTEGLPVGTGERSVMTGLMRNIADNLEAEGRKRCKPFMLAVRTPDDAAYCNTIGLEIEKWMAEGLIDIYIPSGYFRMNSWEYSVRLGHEYGVKVYPGLSESRVGGGHHKDSLRSSDEGYRARAVNAWNAGADGIYIFNLFDPDRRVWREIGEPEILKNLDKVYFPSFRGSGRVAGGAYPHKHFINIPTLNPGEPAVIAPGERKSVKIDIGEKPAAAAGEDPPEIQLMVQILPDLKDMENFTISFNGNRLSGEKQNRNIEFTLEAGHVRRGQNMLEVYYCGERSDIRIADVMVCINYSSSPAVDESYLEQTRDMM